MKNSKKVVSSILAVLMLVSMLACFTLPATAEEVDLANCYYVYSPSDWNKVADEINSDDNNGAGKIIYVQSDVNFDGSAPTQIKTFAGTLDGKGYKFTKIAMSNTESSLTDYSTAIGLIGTLTGTVQNLTLSSNCSFENSSSLYFGSSTIKLGAFAATSNGGTIKKCASYAQCTSTVSGAIVGGFVGESTGVTIDGCVFGGTITNSSGAAGAFIGNLSSGTSAISNSVAKGTVTASTATADAACFTEASNSYVVTDSAYGSAQTKTDLNEAVYTINSQRLANLGTCEIYLNVDGSGVPCFGDADNRVVKLTNEETSAITYHAPRATINGSTCGQTEITVDTVAGKTPVVTGARYLNGKIYVGSSDIITLSYVDVEKEYVYVDYSEAKAQLQTLADAYRQMSSAYFTEWAPVKAWLVNADAALATVIDTDVTGLEGTDLTDKQAQIELDETYYRDRLLACIAAEEELESYLVEMTEPEDYPSVADYNIYKHIDVITDFKVATKEDWLAAVAMSDYTNTAIDAVNFEGATLHLAADIDMESAPMKPLCYGWIFDGDLDGHDHVFQNINIDIDSAYGPVGLIGAFGYKAARTIQNLGIESGTVEVTGWPRFKSELSVTYTANVVGGIVGKNCIADSLLRKCWNNAEINAENGNYAVAGIIGCPKTGAIIDSCFNLGYTNFYGIHGYGYSTAKTFNSMSGAANNYAMWYKGSLVSNAENIDDHIKNVCGVKNTLYMNNWSSDSTTEKAWQASYETANTFLSNAAAAWSVNKNYVQKTYGNGERIYYTLNQDGNVRFGDETNQIYRIALVCDQNCDGDGDASCTTHTTHYAYGAPGQELELGFDFGANYFACDNEKVTISENTLTFEEDIVTTDMTITVHVGLDADRGNVIQDYDSEGKSKINVLDVLKAVKLAVANSVTLSDKLTADVTGDYAVDVTDAYQLVRYVFGDKEKVCFTPGLPAEDEDDYLKVLSYNIKGTLYDPNGSETTPFKRYNAVLAELKAADADIIGFQEMLAASAYTNQEDLLGKIFTDLENWNNEYTVYDYVGTRTTGSKPGGNGIISKYPIISSETVYFKGKERLDGDRTQSLDDNYSTPRAFTWYQIDLNDNDVYDQGTDIIYYNTHLATGLSVTAELQYIINYMNDHHANDRVVCTGDFNLAGYKMKEALKTNPNITALNGGDQLNGFIRTNGYSGSMVDNILINNHVEYFKFGQTDESGATALTNSSVRYDANQNVTTDPTLEWTESWTASDHIPIWAYIKK